VLDTLPKGRPTPHPDAAARCRCHHSRQAFAAAAELVGHMRDHALEAGERPFECGACAKVLRLTPSSRDLTALVKSSPAAVRDGVRNA
jgi:hypothetical protein